MPALDDYALIAPGIDEAAMRKKVAQFAPVVLEADLSHLPESERQVVAKLIEASRLLDPIFDRQVWAAYPRHHERLRAAAEDGGAREQLVLEYFEIMRGPWDRQDHFAPFAIIGVESVSKRSLLVLLASLRLRSSLSHELPVFFVRQCSRV